MTVLGDKLSEALANDLNSFIWKGPKINGVQEEIKLVDADYDQLRKFYKHCMEMLYNKDFNNPGRHTLLEIVQGQIQKCRAELLIRWLRSEKQYTNTRCLEDLRQIITNNREQLTKEVIKTYPIGNVMKGLPIDLERVPIGLVMDACLDSLGIYSGKHITLNFIIKMGLWFTPQEMQKPVSEGGLCKKNPETGKIMNRLELVSKELKLPSSIILRINDQTGLSYSEFKSMYKLRTDKYANLPIKYTNLTTEQLKTLSNKILYRFQDLCLEQAQQWENKVKEILKVAESKGWDVTREIE